MRGGGGHGSEYCGRSAELEGHLHLDVAALVHGVDLAEGGGKRLQHGVGVLHGLQRNEKYRLYLENFPF